MTLVFLIAVIMAFVLGARFLKILEHAVIAYENCHQPETLEVEEAEND